MPRNRSPLLQVCPETRNTKPFPDAGLFLSLVAAHAPGRTTAWRNTSTATCSGEMFDMHGLIKQPEELASHRSSTTANKPAVGGRYLSRRSAA